MIDPLVFDKYGTDAARFALTAASTAGLTLASGIEAGIGPQLRQQNLERHALRPAQLRRRARHSRRRPLDWETGIAPPELADQWILSRLNRVALEVRDALAEFRFHEAASTLYHFFWNDFCDWYIEMSKPFVTAKDPTPQSTAVKRRIVYALEQSLRLLHPVMHSSPRSFGSGCRIKARPSALRNSPRRSGSDRRARRTRDGLVIEVITRLRNIRSTFNIAPSIPLKAQIAPADASTRDLIARMEDHVKRLARIEELQIVDLLPCQERRRAQSSEPPKSRSRSKV